ncbi:hypothetical protein [Streptomyces sp. NPDC056672]|uniref:hypothetical protein n=1 Tax=Streptomyces sp. NPDC056672 TaxID=3345906 RepID=UPI003682AD4B
MSDKTGAAFRREGFVVIPDVLGGEQTAGGRRTIAALLERQSYPDGHTGPYFLWPGFHPAGHPLLDFYRKTGIEELANQRETVYYRLHASGHR